MTNLEHIIEMANSKNAAVQLRQFLVDIVYENPQKIDSDFCDACTETENCFENCRMTRTNSNYIVRKWLSSEYVTKGTPKR